MIHIPTPLDYHKLDPNFCFPSIKCTCWDHVVHQRQKTSHIHLTNTNMYIHWDRKWLFCGHSIETELWQLLQVSTHEGLCCGRYSIHIFQREVPRVSEAEVRGASTNRGRELRRMSKLCFWGQAKHEARFVPVLWKWRESGD